MLWKKKNATSPAPPSFAPSKRPVIDEEALARTVRSYGKYAFDTDSTDAECLSTECEQWAERLLVGNRSELSAENEIELLSALVGFLREARTAEADYVDRTGRNLRSAITTLVSCFASGAAEDATSEDNAAQLLLTLKRSEAQAGTPTAVETARQLVQVLRRAMRARRRRQEEQLQSLGRQIKNLQQELSSSDEVPDEDPETGLHGSRALSVHLERVCDLRLLLPHPPALLLVRVPALRSGKNSLTHAICDTLLRVFFRKQDFLARTAQDTLGVVVFGSPSEQLRDYEERVVRNLQSLLEERPECRGLDTAVHISLGQPKGAEGALELLDRVQDALSP